MTTFRVFLCLLLSFSGLLAQTGNEIYNDDPMQKLPLGVEEPTYARREVSTGPVATPRIEPPFWWIGMVHPELEILIHDTGVRDLQPRIEQAGITIAAVNRLGSANYLFVTIRIAPGTRAGKMTIDLLDKAGAVQRSYPYELRERTSTANRHLGLDASDLIYLIMPDRFANGDTGNDNIAGMQQMGTNREKVFFRHGGDLLGIMEHLDYLQDLGITALWLNPVLENDEPYESYHGYAITDHYAIDARLGTNDQYRQLTELAHARGMKVVMDVIFNHVGDQHWFIRDLPDEEWIHQFDEFTKTTYRAPTLMDPHAATSDRALMTDGWFDKHMPDLNQQQPQLATYLIQNSIWWAEYSGQDGYRIDTYAYPDGAFMAHWNERMREEFPNMGIFGETWVHGAAIQAWFTQGRHLHPDWDTHLPGVTDFQLYYAINEALSREQGWTEGAARLYYTLAQDFLYEDPYRNVLFLDNHDLARFYTTVGGDMTKYKSGLALLLTLRGIPMLYYGTELLLGGSGGGFGEGGRVDFPGGWPKDKTDKFKAKNRTEAEQAAFSYVQRLARYRQQTPALQQGKLTQYVPENGIYVYFRHDTEKTVMVVFNSNEAAATVPTSRYREHLAGYIRARDITRDAAVTNLQELELKGKEVRVLELAVGQ